MAPSASDVAREIRNRLPEVPVQKLHKLLYYAQAHHLAMLGRPLFDETVSAWDRGPVVGQLWKAEKDGTPPPAAVDLDEAQLNTVGYVLARYGQLTGRDLETLSHGELPWQRADEHRKPGESVRIERVWMQDYFRRAADDDGPRLDPGEVEALLQGAEARLKDPSRPDDLDEIAARVRAVA